MVTLYSAPSPQRQAAPPRQVSTHAFEPLVINGEIVSRTLIASEVQNHDAPRGRPEIAYRKAVNAVTVRTLLLQEAHRRRLQPQPAAVGQGRFETDEEALIRALLEAVVEVAPPSEEALRAEWARDPSRFRSPPLWEVSHILCACDPRDEDRRKTSFTRAAAVVRLALGDPDRFAALARDNSDCSSKTSGGKLGQLRPGDTVPEFEAALRRLAAGEITTEPVQTRHGWHIIRMDAVAEGAILPFAAVRQKISEAMEKALWAREARIFVQQLIASARISGADLRSV